MKKLFFVAAILLCVLGNAQVDTFRIDSFAFISHGPEGWSLIVARDSLSPVLKSNMVYRHPVHTPENYAVVGVSVRRANDAQLMWLNKNIPATKGAVYSGENRMIDGLIFQYGRAEEPLKKNRQHTSCSYSLRMSPDYDLSIFMDCETSSGEASVMADTLDSFAARFIGDNKKTLFHISPYLHLQPSLSDSVWYDYGYFHFMLPNDWTMEYAHTDPNRHLAFRDIKFTYPVNGYAGKPSIEISASSHKPERDPQLVSVFPEESFYRYTDSAGIPVLAAGGSRPKDNIEVEHYREFYTVHTPDGNKALRLKNSYTFAVSTLTLPEFYVSVVLYADCNTTMQANALDNMLWNYILFLLSTNDFSKWK